MYRKLFIVSLIYLLVFLLTLHTADAQAPIRGPWLWMIAPTEVNQGGQASTNVDSLSAASGGRVTETNVATNGAQTGDIVGNYAWTPGVLPENGDINAMLIDIGMTTNRDLSDHSSYALITVVSGTAQHGVLMGASSDDSIKIWLNGEVVYTNAVNRGRGGTPVDIFDYQDRFSVNLNRGNNLLMVKVGERGGGWGQYVGINANVTYRLPDAETVSNVPFFAQKSPQWHLPEGATARLGKGTIWDIAYSPDGSQFAVAGGIGIWIYDAFTGTELALLTGHNTWVESVVYSPDGKTIVSGNRDHTVRLWDAETHTLKNTLTGHNGWVESVAYSPDGRTLASGSSDGMVHLWDMATSTLKNTLSGHTNRIKSLAYSPDSTTLASSSDDRTVRLWDVATGTHINMLTGHTATVLSVAYSPDGRTLASGGGHGDNSVRLWDAATGTLKNTLQHIATVLKVTYSPDGRTLASASWREVRLWDAATGTLKNTLQHTDWVYSVVYSPDGRTLASGGRYSNNTVRFWDAATGTLKNTLTGHTSSIYSVAYSPDGRTLASGAWGEVRVWDMATGTLKNTLTEHTHSHWVFGVAYSPDSRTIVSGSWREVRLWDVATGTLKNTLTGHTDLIESVAYSPDGRTIASGSRDRTVRLWDAATGAHINTITGHTHHVTAVAYSPDGRIIVSGSADGVVRLWDAATGMLKNTLENTAAVRSLAYSPDGKTIAWGDTYGVVRIWDTATGTLLHTLSGAATVAYSPDGKTLAGVAGNGDVQLWNTATGTLLNTFTGHSNSVTAATYSPDGETLAIGAWDGVVFLWDVTPTTNATLSFAPAPVPSPSAGQQLILNLNITDGENIAGYQVTVEFDATTLRFVSSENGDYLPTGAFAVPAVVKDNTVTIAATSLAGESAGDGTLATLTFEVIAAEPSTLAITEALLTDSDANVYRPQVESTQITEPEELNEDINKDGVVNIQDLVLVAASFGATGESPADVNGDGVVNILDLTLVAAEFGNTAAAPETWSLNMETVLTRAEVEAWIREARQLNLTGSTSQRGILVLEQLLAALTPKETVLLPNYPNPFNPETWIPYQLANPAEVTLRIHAIDGSLVRTLSIGHKAVGIYQSRSRAAYWDGRNALGEPVASGLYFYTLTAGEFNATRKMLIRK